MKNIHKILIIQTAFIGDVILITPLIRATKTLYPDALIDVLVVPAAVKLLQNNPHIHAVFSFSKRQNPLISMLKTIQHLKYQHYDMAISPHSSGRTHLVMFLSRIPIRIGFDRGTLPWLLTAKTKHPKGIHKSIKNLELLKLLSPKEFTPATELFPSKEDWQMADDLLAPFAGKKLVAMAPGSIWATKCWRIENFIEVANYLIQEGFAIVLIGAETDKAKCDEVQLAFPDAPILNLAGKTNLLQSAAIIGRCDLMICNDSGALHIANAIQTRVFAMFGPTIQRFGYFPFREGDRVFEVELNCRPCGAHGHDACPQKHHNCMRHLFPQPIIKAINAALENEPIRRET